MKFNKLTARQPGSPGSHPNADQPNWRPASTSGDYTRNREEGMESYSERHVAKLLGISRAELWHWKLMADLPEDLFEALMKGSRTRVQRRWPLLLRRSRETAEKQMPSYVRIPAAFYGCACGFRMRTESRRWLARHWRPLRG